MSEWKMSTEEAITQDHAGLKKTYRKQRMWFPLLFLVSTSLIVTNEIMSDSDNLLFIAATELVILSLAWGLYSTAVERDVLKVKFVNASKHIDYLLEYPRSSKGSWEWDEDAQETYIAWAYEDERMN